MTHHAVDADAALRMAVQAKAHIELIDRNDPIHRLDRSMAALTCDPRANMRAMIESHKVGKLINPVPLDFQRLRFMVSPGLHDRLQSSGLDPDISVASNALLDRWSHRELRN